MTWHAGTANQSWQRLEHCLGVQVHQHTSKSRHAADGSEAQRRNWRDTRGTVSTSSAAGKCAKMRSATIASGSVAKGDCIGAATAGRAPGGSPRSAPLAVELLELDWRCDGEETTITGRERGWTWRRLGPACTAQRTLCSHAGVQPAPDGVCSSHWMLLQVSLSCACALLW